MCGFRGTTPTLSGHIIEIASSLAVCWIEEARFDSNQLIPAAFLAARPAGGDGGNCRAVSGQSCRSAVGAGDSFYFSFGSPGDFARTRKDSSRCRDPVGDVCFCRHSEHGLRPTVKDGDRQQCGQKGCNRRPGAASNFKESTENCDRTVAIYSGDPVQAARRISRGEQDQIVTSLTAAVSGLSREQP